MAKKNIMNICLFFSQIVRVAGGYHTNIVLLTQIDELSSRKN